VGCVGYLGRSGAHKREVKIMSEDKQDMSMSKKETKKRKEQAESTLPFCTTAPSAEHARRSNEDEPCNDSRAGE
jgi:hypothetical protein